MGQKFFCTANRFASEAEASARRVFLQGQALAREGKGRESLGVVVEYVEWRLQGACEPFEGADRTLIHLLQDIQASLP